MSIKDFNQKIKLNFFDIKDRLYSSEKGLKIKADIFIVFVIILVGLASFGLGKLSAFEKKKVPISISETSEKVYLSQNNESQTQSLRSEENKGVVVASRSGTKYYYPWCSGVARIKEENKVWFNSIEEAKSKGLSPASGCLGLK